MKKRVRHKTFASPKTGKQFTVITVEIIVSS